MTRLDFFKNKVSCSQLLRHNEYRDCDEFVVDRWGDVVTYRVYGSNKENYYIVVQ